MPNQLLLEKYAKLAVVTGANVQKGQVVVIRTTTDAVELTRKVADVAYQHGAKKVYVIWNDEYISRSGYDYAQPEDLSFVPSFVVDQYKYFVEEKSCLYFNCVTYSKCIIWVSADLLTQVSNAFQKSIQFFREHTMGNGSQWTIVAASNPVWAKHYSRYGTRSSN